MIGKRLLRVGWKIAVVLVIGCVIVYRVHFAAVEVNSYEAEVGQIRNEVMGTGTLEARVQATISPKISGRISEVLVDDGISVIKGQKLVTLDDEELRQQVEVAKAELSWAQAGVEKAIAQIKSAEATLKEAERVHTRMSQAVSSGALSVNAFEKAQQLLEVAKAELSQAQTAKIEAERLIAKNEAYLQFCRAQLDYTTITAPFDGLIVKRYRDPGDIVVPGSMVLDMISLEQLWISAWVDETMLGKLKVGQRAKIVFRSEPQNELAGKVARISPQADRETREVLVDVEIEQMPEIWAVGQRAEVYIETAGKEEATVVPQRVIVWRQQQPGVYVMENGKAYWHKVVLGIKSKDKVEVREGLNAGQTVLICGLKLLRDGRAVKAIKK